MLVSGGFNFAFGTLPDKKFCENLHPYKISSKFPVEGLVSCQNLELYVVLRAAFGHLPGVTKDKSYNYSELYIFTYKIEL